MRGFLNGKEIKVHLECFPCFLNQSVIALRLGTEDKTLQEKVMKGVLEEIENTDISKSPAHATTYMHRLIRRMLGGDPFRHIKSEYNEKALALYPKLKKTVSESNDPLRVASRLAIAGNVIDFGIYTSVDIEGTVERALNQPLEVDEYPAFRHEVENATGILYLLDNAGEIVFDRILMEALVSSGKKVTAVVKGSPVINDCTMEDAVQAGIMDLVEVVDNGSDAVGTILEMSTEEFRNRFKKAGLVVSKGQGNFETLLEEDKKMFFLFQSKCGVVSRVLALPAGSMLLARGATAPP